MLWIKTLVSSPLRTLSPLLLLCSSTYSSSSSSSSCNKTRALSSPSPRSPPTPKKIPFTVAAHGRTWDDPYHWMRNTDDPNLRDHLDRENAYADAFMADACGLRRQLAAEMRARIPATVATPPERWGPWLYYQYIPEGKEYPILCRKFSHPDGPVKTLLGCVHRFSKEEVLLDWNEIAEQFGYVHIGTCRISPDHKFLAYTLDSSGSEVFALQVKDLQTKRIISCSANQNVVSLAWAGDSGSLLYTICDETQRPYKFM